MSISAAVADPIDRHLDEIGVDGDERDALLAGARQHIGLAREPDRRASVAHIDIERGVLEQILADSRGQAGAERDGVGVAVLKPLDADLLLVDRERRLVLADDRDERREVGALGQGLAELEAGARARPRRSPR